MHNLPIDTDVSLAPLTTLGVGGAAQYLAKPRSQAVLLECLRWGAQRGLPLWILGGGSNVVIADQGLPGLVVQWGAQGKQIVHEHNGRVDVKVGGGTVWDDWVAWSVQEKLAGLECLSGIPGSVGAAPIQNIGAYGQEVQETFLSASVLDLETLEVSTWDAERCQFAYRSSALKPSAGRRYLVLDVTFRLTRGGPPTVRYAELQRSLEAKESARPLALVRDTVLMLRRRKSMVLDPGDPNSRSAGSFFTNPILPSAQVQEVWERVKHTVSPGATMPQYPAGDGSTKLAAAWLIERSGLSKGDGRGAVGLSQHHALALINRGGATAHELLTFARSVQRKVYQHTGVTLHPEPVFLGFEHADLQAFE